MDLNHAMLKVLQQKRHAYCGGTGATGGEVMAQFIQSNVLVEMVCVFSEEQ